MLHSVNRGPGLTVTEVPQQEVRVYTGHEQNAEVSTNTEVSTFWEKSKQNTECYYSTTRGYLNESVTTQYIV